MAHLTFDLDTVLRALLWANAFLFVLAALMQGIRARRRWGRLNRGGRRLMIGMTLLFVVLAYSAVEAYLTGAWGLRVPLVTVAMGGVIHGLLTLGHDSDLHRPAD